MRTTIEKLISFCYIFGAVILSFFMFKLGRDSKQAEITETSIDTLKEYDKIANKKVSQEELFKEEKW